MSYFIGVDMGTSSVGWAVTDENYVIVRRKGKDLWGVREFDEALPAVERRTNRVARRRRQREIARIGALKEYFHDEIVKVDPNFYQRLENSKYHIEDKDIPVMNKNSIFADEKYTDKEFFSQYPTIYHLRKELINSDKPHDIRLVFLALLNMFKHRGHFLNATLGTDSDNRKIYDIYMEFILAAEDILGISFPIEFDREKFESVLIEKSISKKKKSELLVEILGLTKKDKQQIAIVQCICGMDKSIKDMYGNAVDEDFDKSLKVNFSNGDFEEKENDIISVLGDGKYELIQCIKEIYDTSLLKKLLGESEYLSEARVLEYDKHKNDLKLLKKAVRKYTADKYDYMFRSLEKGTYGSYVNSFNSGEKMRRNGGVTRKDELYSTIKGLFKNVTNDNDVNHILADIENDLFLPKQLTASNGVIPNQVHLKEMKKILDNAEHYLAFLKEKDDSGLTVSERILKLFSFQIPYYVGPLSENSAKFGGNGWVVRKEAGQVLPWNIEKKVDLKKTSEEFISRMVRRCTYLNGEQVLPKTSLEYQRYCVLNELNNLRVSGEKIPVDIKQCMYKDLFEKGKRVTKKQICTYLVGKGILEKNNDYELTGLNDGINSTLGSFAKFKAIFKDKIYEDEYFKMSEQIIFWSTVYGDSRNFLKERIEEAYGDKLTQEQIKRILGLKFKDWGNLSKEFLELSGHSKDTGEIQPLIEMMWNTGDNLMEILDKDRYSYMDEVEKRQNNAHKLLSELTSDDLDDMYFSAPVKRMVWQTLLILKEIEKVMGEAPKRVFVEMTRGGGKKKDIPDSRAKKFRELYKKIKDEDKGWDKVIDNAEENGTIRTKKMYLYLAQRGRSMYTGKTIDLDQLFNDNIYDIDHIYPRHFIKDDNIDNNLVLVEKEKNGHKSDNYPIEDTIYQKMLSTWKELHRQGFINEEKFKRLTGRMPLSDEQKAGFIARQLVETGQGTKAVMDILKNALPDTALVYSKAGNVSDFRDQFEMWKSRNVNDFHHAQDAYLNIVVGNVYYVKFTKNPFAVLKEGQRYNVNKMFNWDVVRGKDIAWIAKPKDGQKATIETVKKMMAKNTPLLTRKSIEGSGGISNQTIYSARKAKKEGYIPVKGNDEKLKDVTKYGGFTSVSTAYLILVEHTVKKKRVRTIEAVPIIWKEKIEKDPEQLMVFCKEQLELVDPDIRLKKILMQSLIKKDGYYMYISGKTGKRYSARNAVSLCLNREWINYIKKLEKPERFSDVMMEKNVELYDILTEKHLNTIFAKKPNPIGEKLKKGRDKFIILPLEGQVKIIFEILKLTQLSVMTADLSAIGETANAGKTLISKEITNSAEFYLINQSVTGIFEEQVDLLTV